MGNGVLPFRLVYHERYDLNIGEHVFPAKKYQWLRDRLTRTRFAAAEDLVTPAPAADEDVLLAHDAEWVAKLRSGTLTYQDILRLEIPYSRQMVEAFWLAAGGTILAARLALEHGVGFNIGGGFHHAFPGARRGVLRDQRHRGGGAPAATGRRDPARDGGGLRRAPRQRHRRRCSPTTTRSSRCRFTSSTTTRRRSRRRASTSTWRTGSATRSICTGSATGIARRSRCSSRSWWCTSRGRTRTPEDQLGGLSLTFDGLRERDRLVIWTALSHGMPVAIVLAGGYAQSVEDTITIHANTAAVAKEVLLKVTSEGQARFSTR